MTDETTVYDVGFLIKTALTGPKNLKSAAIKLLSLLPSYFNDLEQAQKQTTKHTDIPKV